MSFWALVAAAAPLAAADDSVPPGKATYETMCALCHGMRGEGDGPGAAAFPKDLLTNFRSGPMRYATERSKMKEIIRKGGVGVGLSPLMPAQPALSEEEIEALVNYIVLLREDQ